jgi:hypothetical protein
MDLYDLKSHHHILSGLECSAIFDDDGSVEYKEFIKQFERYQISTYFLDNYYSFQIIKNGIEKYANDNFWEEFYSH